MKWIFNILGISLLVVLLLAMFVAIKSEIKDKIQEAPKTVEQKDIEYTRGVNSALDTIMLLSLELKLCDSNMTWGAMADVVCQRLSVERKGLDK